MTALVSVIIPTFNRAALLAETIASVLKQTYPSIDILVVDDGSTDNTRAIVSTFGERVRYIYQTNQERAAARNQGLSLAKGELVCFLDSDDLFEPTHVALLADLFERDPSLALVSTDYTLIDARGTILRPIHAAGRDGNVFQTLLRRNYICTSSAMLRRRFLEPFNVDRSLSGSEDWELWLRLAAKYPFAHVPQATIRFRAHDSATMGNPDALAKSCMRALEITFSNPALQVPLRGVSREKIEAAQMRILANAYYAAGQMKSSRLMLAKAKERDPSLAKGRSFAWAWMRTYLGKHVTRAARKLRHTL